MWEAVLVIMDKEDTEAFPLSALLDRYRRGHPLHTLASMAAQLAEHPAILLIEVVLVPYKDPLIAEVLVRVEPAAYPLTDELRQFGDAVEVATGMEFLFALLALWPDEPDIGHAVFFGPVST